MRSLAEIEHLLGDIRIVRRPEEHGHIQPEGGAGDRQQLEIAAMGGKDDERSRIVAQLEEDRDARNFDAARLRVFRIEIEELVEKDVFGSQPADTAPAFERDRLDLRLALFGKGIAQIGQGQLVPALQLRPEPASEPIGEFDRAIGRKQLQTCRASRKIELGDRPLAEVLRRKNQPGDQHAHDVQSIRRMILPKTWRVSIRSSARSISLKPTSVSMTG